MAITGCMHGDCPTIYTDGADSGEILVQGYAAVAEGINVPDGEHLVKIPVDLLLDAATAIVANRVDVLAARVSSWDSDEPVQPHTCTQVFINDIDTATPDELRAEVRRLDLRLRWMHDHNDEATSVGLMTAFRLAEQRDATLAEQQKNLT